MHALHFDSTLLHRDDAGNWQYRGSASSVLDLYAVLREYLRSVFRPLLDHPDGVVRDRARPALPALQSYDALCHAIDGVLSAKYGRSPDDLQARIQAHLDAYTAAYGDENVVPKHHWALHLPEQIAADGGVLDCFVDERANKGVKAYARHIENWTALDRSVASRYVQNHGRLLIEGLEPNHFDTPAGRDSRLETLVLPLMAGHGIEAQGIEAAAKMRIVTRHGGAVTVSRGAFIAAVGAAGTVSSCIATLPSRDVWLVVRQCRQERVLAPECSVWRQLDQLLAVPPTLVLDTCLVRTSGDELTVLQRA